MKKLSDNDLDKALRAQDPGATMRDAEDFWSDFKGRARMRAQEAPVGRTPVPVGRWAMAGACSALVLILAVVYMFGPMQTEAVAGVIKSVEVVATHSAVLVIDDEADDYAMVWVVDMEMDAENGGGA